MTALEIIQNTLAGGLLGILGQGIRMIAGIKKANDPTVAQEPITSSRIIYSLFLGFIAGGLGIWVKGGDPITYDRTLILAIIAVGYSGADFIEGVMKNQLNINNDTPKPAPIVKPA